jgi:hypothetical protein
MMWRAVAVASIVLVTKTREWRKEGNDFDVRRGVKGGVCGLRRRAFVSPELVLPPRVRRRPSLRHAADQREPEAEAILATPEPGRAAEWRAGVFVIQAELPFGAAPDPTAIGGRRRAPRRLARTVDTILACWADIAAPAAVARVGLHVDAPGPAADLSPAARRRQARAVGAGLAGAAVSLAAAAVAGPVAP